MRWVFYFSWGTRPLSQPWHSIGLAIAGVLCSAFAVYSYWTTSSFLDSSVETQGTVIKLIQRRGGSVYHPVVQYYDSAGVKRVLLSSTGSNPPRFSINERVTIAYAPGNPSDAKIKAFSGLWLTTVVTGLLGSAAFMAALFLAWVYRKRSSG